MKLSLKPVFCAIGTLFALSACATTPSTSPSPSASAPQSGSSEQIVLALSNSEFDDGFDPTLGWGRYGSPLFQSTLLRRNSDLKFENDLATNYSVSADGKVWTVTIRSDAKFSDGKPVTAEDVAVTFTKAGENGGKTDVTVLQEAIAINPTTVELRLKQPQSTFINRLATLGIVPKHAYSENYGRKPIGSGPYQLVQWDEGQQLIATVNPNYYGAAPEIKRLVFLLVEEDAAFAAAKAGQAQVASVPQTLAVQSVENMKLYDVESVDNRGIMFPYVPNEGKKTPSGAAIGNNVTADLAIRQAVNFGIDRKALVDGILEGYGSPAYTPVSGLPWEQQSANIEDGQVDRAKQVLAAGGWSDKNGDGVVEKNGQAAEFTILYPASDSIRQALALSVSEQVKPLGIRANVQGKSWDEIKPLMHSNVILFGWGSQDPTEVYNLYHSKSAQGDFNNAGYYANSKIDKTLDLAVGAPSQEEAIAFWQAAQWDGQTGFSAKGDAAWAWLVNLDHTYFVHNCLDIGTPQIEPHGHGWPITANISEWRWTCK
jgi:peptide/nickel transport system substrate-binding protein